MAYRPYGAGSVVIVRPKPKASPRVSPAGQDSERRKLQRAADSLLKADAKAKAKRTAQAYAKQARQVNARDARTERERRSAGTIRMGEFD